MKSKSDEEQNEVEINSGVTFPGESMECFIGTNYKLSDDNFN